MESYYDKKLVKFIQDNGAIVKLHICGNITSLLPLIKQVNPDILDIDWMVDFKNAVDTFADTKTGISGNVDPVAVLLQGDSTIVEKSIRECLSVDDSTFLIAAGCEVPIATPEENLLLMDKLLYL